MMLLKLAVGLFILVLLFIIAVVLLTKGSDKDILEDYHNDGEIGGG